MRILVTGAAGFVGHTLVQRLLKDGLAGQPVDQLVLMDLAFAEPPSDTRVTQFAGSIADPALRQRALVEPVDVVFHLASCPGGLAEKNYALGRSINLDASLGLLEDLRVQPKPARFVFASSVAVYGANLPAVVDEATQPAPALSYGTHKLMVEALVADATRLGWVQGCSLRVPGVVARPGEGAGLLSAFMSQLFWRLRDGQPITVPVSARGQAWWISVGACVDNLLQAACIAPDRLDARRVYQMPALHLTVAEVVDALAARFGVDRQALVAYAPDAQIERLFASFPPLLTPRAASLGFVDDGDVELLVHRVVNAQQVST
nr:NAD-dependent epimerase/dehydratase family protein [uncultured Albidiferax sp.]